MRIRSMPARPHPVFGTICRWVATAVLATVSCGWCISKCEAQPPFVPQEPAPLEEPKKDEIITQADLEEADRFRMKIESARDNAFIYTEQRDEYLQVMSDLPGMKLEWPASVVRVTGRTVELRHSQYGRTRVVLVHYRGDGTHSYGSLEYNVPRCVTPSAYRYARHAATPELQIGLEIPLELAKTLRAGDLVQLSGNIEHVDTRLIKGNAPDTLIYVANLEARKFLTVEELDEIEDQKRAAARAKRPAAPSAPTTETAAE